MKLTDGKRTIEIECYTGNGVEESEEILYPEDQGDMYTWDDEKEMFICDEDDLDRTIKWFKDEFIDNYERYQELEKEYKDLESNDEEYEALWERGIHDLYDYVQNYNMHSDYDCQAWDEDYECYIYKLKNGEWERIMYISEGEVEK